MKYHLKEDRAKRLQQVLKTFSKNVNRWHPGPGDMGQRGSSALGEVPQRNIFVYLKDCFNHHRMTLLANPHQYFQTKKTVFCLKTRKHYCSAELLKLSLFIIKGNKKRKK